MTELWKDIKGYEGLYQVSDLGRVRRDGRVLKTPPDSNGYCITVLCKEGRRKTAKVHRLVAEAFCEKDECDTEINHIDECKGNNRADNLEWCTRVQNIRHGTGISRHALSQKNKHGSKCIAQYTIDGTFIKDFSNAREIQRQLGYDRAYVMRCAKGINRSAYGYKWEYTGEIVEQ